MRLPTMLSAALFWLFAANAQAAGLSVLEVPAGGDMPMLKGAVWSPCAAPDQTVKLQRIELPGVRDCPVKGEGLALIVISHGAFGWFGGHHDTAAALADAGYVVAAITHSNERTRRWRTERPAAIKRVIDHMLTAWHGHAKLDPKRIGVFGFSRGGYTGLVAIGGVPDFRLAGEHCRKIPSDPLCRHSPKTPPPTGGPPPDYAHDPRIKAAVIAAPLGIVFSADGMKKVTVPVQLWRAENDELATHHNIKAVREACRSHRSIMSSPMPGTSPSWRRVRSVRSSCHRKYARTPRVLTGSRSTRNSMPGSSRSSTGIWPSRDVTLRSGADVTAAR